MLKIFTGQKGKFPRLCQDDVVVYKCFFYAMLISKVIRWKPVFFYFRHDNMTCFEHLCTKRSVSIVYQY